MALLRRSNESQLVWIAGATVLLVSMATGCHQAQRFRASNLPAELTAPPLASLRNIDLSGIARSDGNNNRLYAGDLVEITIATGLEVQDPPLWRGRVGEDGAVAVPLVGKVRVAGLESVQAEQRIRDESINRGKFVDPNVTLVRIKQRSNLVTVVGAVEKPGTYELPVTGCDVLSALVMAGGVTDEAGTVVELRHPPRRIATAQLGTPQLASFHQDQTTVIPASTVQIKLERAQNSGTDFQLYDGSTVMVMQRPQRYVHVIGLVKRADQFEFPENQELRLLDALALAGGRTLSIADRVQIIRTVPGRTEPVVITASVSEAKNGPANIRLAAGDVVSVEETPATFVVGTIREFVGFGFTSTIPGL